MKNGKNINKKLTIEIDETLYRQLMAALSGLIWTFPTEAREKIKEIEQFEQRKANFILTETIR